MLIKTLQILLVFVVALWAAVVLFDSSEQVPTVYNTDGSRVFAKDIRSQLKQGQLVIVDKSINGSDNLIQENLSTHDLPTAVTFARYKAELLEQPLYIESRTTYNKPESVAVVNPTDRKAWQELILDEIYLKDKYSRQHPNDLKGYQEQKALDPERTPKMMLQLIDHYPDSHVTAAALAHIEYTLCVARQAPDQAIEIYNQLETKYASEPYLKELLPDYRERAQQYKSSHAFQKDA